MKILGYNSYHIYECVAVRGLTHMQIFKEGIIAQYNRLAGVKRYTRTDFDKWLCDYDVSSVFVFNPSLRFPVSETRQNGFQFNLTSDSVWWRSQATWAWI